MTTVTIHQPMYLPYIGFFDKIKKADIFVFGDDAQYSKGYYYNRNQIKTPQGPLMLTVPLIKPFGKKLNEIRIDNNKNWGKKHFQSLHSFYKKADYFEEYIGFFEEIYNFHWQTLHELNLKTLLYLLDELDIDIPTYFTSSLLKNYVSTDPTKHIIDICNELGADKYLSGISGKNYIKPTIFKENNIALEYQNYLPKEYNQLWGTFVPNLSVVDLLFNVGKNASQII